MRKIIFLLFLIPILGISQIELKGVLTTGNSGTDVWEYIDPNNGKIYAVVGGNGMSMVDVTDPANPVEVSHLTSVPGFDVKVWQNYVYCVTGGGGTAQIVDISDPANPVIAGSWPSSHNIHIDSNGYLYASSPGTTIYDLNPNPTSPTYLTDIGTEGHDVTIRGNRMIDAHGFAGTYIYDITDPSSPQFLTIITDPDITYHHQGDFSTDGNYLYICDELGNHPQADITVWDITDYGNPTKVDETADPSATPHNLYVIGDYAFTSYYTAGFRVFDISDPSTLVLADEYDTSSATGEGFAGAFGVYPSPTTGNIYINDGSGLYIFGFDGLLG
ncbi:MAG: choice-of-anchor B family protein, partial [Flavobacteriaceae bacterium]|nr:choice-of-anchor B family protein [Flavobacteriaceae bacterium]